MMLSAQVEYWKLQENQRHNLISEALGFGELSEATRHNKESEALGWGNLKETARHNLASESIGWANVDLGWANLNESHRHNVQTEGLGWASLGETKRHNVASESIAWTDLDLKKVLGYQDIRIRDKQTDIQGRQADAAEKNASTNFLNYVNESKYKAKNYDLNKENIESQIKQRDVQNIQSYTQSFYNVMSGLHQGAGAGKDAVDTFFKFGNAAKAAEFLALIGG